MEHGESDTSAGVRLPSVTIVSSMLTAERFPVGDRRPVTVALWGSRCPQFRRLCRRSCCRSRMYEVGTDGGRRSALTAPPAVGASGPGCVLADNHQLG